MIESLGNAVRRTGTTGELRCWIGIGISALAIAGLLAFMLALSRIPGIENTISWPLGFFEKGLVIHVIMSFVVWFLAIFAGILVISGTGYGITRIRFGSLGPIALLLAVTGFVFLTIPAFLDRGVASLNNYIPVIIDPLYHAGLSSLAVSFCILITRMILNLAQNQAMRRAGSICSVIFLSALSCMALAYGFIRNEPLNEAFYETLFWGGGHVLQFLNTALMITGWYILYTLSLPATALHNNALRGALALCVLPALAAPVLYPLMGVDSGTLFQTFTDMQYLLAPPALIMGFVLLSSLLREIRNGFPLRRHFGLICILLSMAAFAIGGTLGLFVDGADTRTPAHYHAVIAAVNIVFMGLVFQFFLPVMGRSAIDGRAARALVWLYAAGQMIASIGLFLAGGHGAPRKTAGAAQGLEEIGAIAGLWMNGLGAAIAVIGGIMFIWISARALLQRR